MVLMNPYIDPSSFCNTSALGAVDAAGAQFFRQTFAFAIEQEQRVRWQL